MNEQYLYNQTMEALKRINNEFGMSHPVWVNTVDLINKVFDLVEQQADNETIASDLAEYPLTRKEDFL